MPAGEDTCGLSNLVVSTCCYHFLDGSYCFQVTPKGERNIGYMWTSHFTKLLLAARSCRIHVLLNHDVDVPLLLFNSRSKLHYSSPSYHLSVALRSVTCSYFWGCTAKS